MTKRITIKLDKVLKDKGLSQTDLKNLIDEKYYAHQWSEGVKKPSMRAASISEIYNNQRTKINKNHLEMIINTLNIEDITEIIDIVDD